MQDKWQRNSIGSSGSTCKHVLNNKGHALLQSSCGTGYKVIKTAALIAIGC